MPHDIAATEDSTLAAGVPHGAPQATRILVAEDDLVTSRVLSGLLASWGFDVTVVSDGNAALAVLQADDAPRIAILDWMMPGLDGPEVCRLARERRPSEPLYLILVTSREARVDVVSGLDAGADDYVIKPPDPGELRSRLKAGLRVLALEHHFEREAMADGLTGLPNRRSLNDTFARQLERMRRSSQPVSLLMIDVDHFKRLNDEHGHLVGDAVLRRVAATLRQTARPQDLLARYGGEEFALMLPGLDTPDALKAAERLRHAIAAATSEPGDRPLPRATVSIGVSTVRTRVTLEELIARSDAALYRAKHAGRDCVSQ